MFNFLFSLSNFLLFVFLSIVSIAFSFIAVFGIRRFITHGTRYRDNAALGNISALIGIIYGVLVGVVALYLMNNLTLTTDAVQHEADSAANLYRDAFWLKEPISTNIHDAIKKYLHRVITVEWPLMAEGKNPNSDDEAIIESITRQLHTYNFVTPGDQIILHDMLADIKTLYNARQQRILMSYSGLNTEIWIVILIGTLLTIGINYLFKMNYVLHIITIGAAALMGSSMVFLLLTLDKPFRGEFVINSEPMQSALDYIQRHDVKAVTG